VDTFFSFCLAALVTLFFVRGYLKKLTASQKPGAGQSPATAAAAVRLVPCPRCGKSIPKGSAFCASCGAALAMWKVHSAEVRSAGAAGSAKPKPVINASLCIGCGSCVQACPETGTLELVNHKAILAHPDRCTSHAKCAEVCPTQAIAMASNGVLQTLRVPNVKENFETNVPGVFIVGELAGMGLIKSAINEGKLVIDHLRQRLQQEGPAPESLFDVAIVGSGPAGLSASLAAQQYGMRYITLEQGEIASTIRQYPRQKFLMAEPIEMPLYGSLYIGDGTKEALLSVWETILQNTGVQVRTNERVERVQRNNIGFHVDTPKAQHHARYVVLALGRRGTPRRLQVPGEDLSKVAYRLIEAETYAEKDLLVVGGGDSAIEAALALSRSGKNRVALSYRGDNFDRARERNRQHLDQAAKEGKLEVLRKSNVLEIRADSVAMDLGARRQEMPNDYTFVMVGGESPEEFLRKTGIEIVEKSISL
jgi:thioredoxin reductase